MHDENKLLEDENQHLEEENRRLELENILLEERNRRLERNRQLKERRRQLEEKRAQLEEKNNALNESKRKVDRAFDGAAASHQQHATTKRAKLHGRSMQPAAKAFFSSKHFAVAGASSDPAKYGHKVFVWYLEHKLPVTPINPTGSVTTMGGPKKLLKRVHLAAAAPSRLEHAAATALSVITPPKVTRAVLEDARRAGVRAVWLQPGSFDDEVLEYARREWPGAAIAGTDVPGSAGEDGWCVLVDGEWAMGVAGR